MNIIIKLPLVLAENALFYFFPKSRRLVEKLYNPYFRKNYAEYIHGQYASFSKSVNKYKSLKKTRLLELGPGASVGFGLLAIKEGGLGTYYAIDENNHLNYKKTESLYLDLLGNKKNLEKAKSKVKMISFAKNYSYKMDNSTVDVIYSCAVLEHIKDLEHSISEMTRVLKKGGIMYHSVDLKDHVFSKKSLFFLFIPQKIFNFLFGNTGLWVNRMRLSDYKVLFKKYNLKILDLKVNEVWTDDLPFYLRKKYSLKDIIHLSFDVVLVKM
ncbi:MAG: methyltransferase domain-containing protein [Candidatus Pacebacteria bacterium]|nr:methyltransferase domain-containing protein [Candidatus Paceibacterota bacterium]